MGESRAGPRAAHIGPVYSRPAMSSSRMSGVCPALSSSSFFSRIFSSKTASAVGLRHHSGFLSRKSPPRSAYTSGPAMVSGLSTNSHSSADVVPMMPLDELNGSRASFLPQCSFWTDLRSEPSKKRGEPRRPLRPL